MAWWEETKRYIQHSGLTDPEQERAPRTVWEFLENAFLHDAVDVLYFWVGLFTYIYFFIVAFLYLGALSSIDTVALKIVYALQEPYLGAVGMYTILKEARKRTQKLTRSRHYGEFFVIGWLALFLVSALCAVFFDAYAFDLLLKLIITISISVGIIYIGGVVHKP